MLTHHAYYIEDSLSLFDAYQNGIRASEQFEASDPNYIATKYEKFGIDEARALIELSSLKNTGGRALFVLGAASMTSEAQQALLKLFEEPQEGTIFILLVPHGILLPTLQSRMLKLPPDILGRGVEGGGQANVFSTASAKKLFPAPKDVAKQFLSWPYKKRSDWITEKLKGDDDNREWARGFLNDLESELYTKIHVSKEARESLDEIVHFRQYLSDRSPSLKMILEHFAATLPHLT